MKRILIFLILMIFCMGVVSASENINNTIEADDNDSSLTIYVNSSKETNGDGSNWNNAYNGSDSWNEIHYDKDNNRIDNCIVYLANGQYTQNTSLNYNNCTFIGQGNDTVISFYAGNVYSNAICKFINITFVKKFNLEDNTAYVANLYANYDFINCTFIDLEMNKMGWPTSTKATFQNCLFSNGKQMNLITNKYYGNLKFDSCIFEDIIADAIVYNEACSCTILDNCIFKNTTVKGVLGSDEGRLYGSRIKNATYDFLRINKAPVNSPYYFNSTENLELYVNSSCEVSGDGSSWDNAINSLVTYDDLTVYLSEGNYDIPNKNLNITYIGIPNKTIITSFDLGEYSYLVHDNEITVINATFNPYIHSISIFNQNYTNDNDMYIEFYYNIKADGVNFHFINCDFINSSFISRAYNKNTPDRDRLSQTCSIIFDNCVLKDYDGTYMINNWEYSKFVFNDCIFDNIIGDAISDSYGGQMGANGIGDGIYIYNSQFKNCNVNGIVKARNLGNCVIKKCSYDFDVNNELSLISPFYVNKTDIPLNKTKIEVINQSNVVIITLDDINSNKTIANVEVAIINNGKIFQYVDTNENGQIILDNLSGIYNFEFIYPGDEYGGYEATSLNKTFNFTVNDVSKNTSKFTPTVTKQTIYKVNKKTTKITAKKVTFKVKVKIKKYTIILKANNIPVKKVKVTIKIGKKTYKATTNTKGKATFKITKLSKKSKYAAFIKFAGDKNYKSTRKIVKITVKNK